MTNVTLELSESQVLALVRQLSPKAQQALFHILVSDLEVVWDEMDDWDTAEALFEDAELWPEILEEPVNGWGVPDFWGVRPVMTRRQLLAAETYNYSYAHYAERIGGNIRFDELMPEDVDILEQAEHEDWDDARLAEELEVDEEKVKLWRESYRRARAIIDAPTPAEAFRRGVRFSIQDAVEEGLDDEEAIERLVAQVGYRAADLGFLLDMTGLRLSDYSEELRDESGTDYALSDLGDEAESQTG